jgi:hypothetical protein
MDFLFKRVVENQFFDQADRDQVTKYFMELSAWSSNLEELRIAHNDMEMKAIYFVVKYKRLSSKADDEFKFIEAKIGVEARAKGLKSTEHDFHIYNSGLYQNAKKAKEESGELADIFDRLFWSCVRKHERTVNQQLQNQKQ